MALTFLQLTNRVLKGFNEVNLTSSNFASAQGVHAEAKDAVNAAIEKIYQSQEFQWPFNTTTSTVSLTADGTQEYTLSASAAVIDWESFFIQKATIGSTEVATSRLRPISMDVYRRYYKSEDDDKDASTEYSKPERIVQNFNNKLIISPPADLTYTVEYRYWSAPTKLEDYDDTTDIPDAYESVIVEGARYCMYMFRDNMEQAAISDQRFKDGINTMRRVLCPEQPYVVFDN